MIQIYLYKLKKKVLTPLQNEWAAILLSKDDWIEIFLLLNQLIDQPFLTMCTQLVITFNQCQHIILLGQILLRIFLSAALSNQIDQIKNKNYGRVCNEQFFCYTKKWLKKYPSSRIKITNRQYTRINYL